MQNHLKEEGTQCIGEKKEKKIKRGSTKMLDIKS